MDKDGAEPDLSRRDTLHKVRGSSGQTDSLGGMALCSAEESNWESWLEQNSEKKTIPVNQTAAWSKNLRDFRWRKKKQGKESESGSVVSDPTDYTVHGILQARMEWVAFPFSQSRDGTGVSRIAGGFFTNWAIREAQGRRSSKAALSIIIWEGSELGLSQKEAMQ